MKKSRAFTVLHSCLHFQKDRIPMIGKISHLVMQKSASVQETISRGCFQEIISSHKVTSTDFTSLVKWEIKEWIILSFCYSGLAKEKQIALTKLEVTKHPLVAFVVLCSTTLCYVLEHILTAQQTPKSWFEFILIFFVELTNFSQRLEMKSKQLQYLWEPFLNV